MKFYVYVSDTKVGMLYDQIPSRTLNKISAELKIDLKVLSATFSENVSEKTRFSKLKIVDEFIRKNEHIGTIDEPSSYFQGAMPMRWGPITGGDGELVYFGGITNRTFLGLGGSFKHVIGEVGTSEVSDRPKPRRGLPSGASNAPRIYGILGEFISLIERDAKIMEDSGLKYPMPGANELVLVRKVTRRMKGPLQNLEFLAKRLMWGQDKDGKLLLLGSPIYVALAE